MQLKPRASTQPDYLDFFVYSLPGGGKTRFILSAYNAEENSGPVIFDTDARGVDATASDMGIAGKVPVFEISTDDDMILSCSYPERIIEMVHSDERFKDYQVTLFAWDTLSSMEDILMGETARQQKPTLPASPGSGIMATGRSRSDPFSPAMQDYKGMVGRTKSFLRKVRELPYSTIVTAHAVRAETEDSPRGLSVPAEQKTYATYPDLVGKNRYTAAKLMDGFFYMEHRGKDQHYLYTIPRGGAHSRTRIEGKIPAEFRNPSYNDVASYFYKETNA